jgi:hypothetical protein
MSSKKRVCKKSFYIDALRKLHTNKRELLDRGLFMVMIKSEFQILKGVVYISPLRF